MHYTSIWASASINSVFRLFVLQVWQVCCLHQDKLYIFGILTLPNDSRGKDNPRKICANHHTAHLNCTVLDPLAAGKDIWMKLFTFNMARASPNLTLLSRLLLLKHCLSFHSHSNSTDLTDHTWHEHYMYRYSCSGPTEAMAKPRYSLLGNLQAASPVVLSCSILFHLRVSIFVLP